jgi:hypothetical protein
MGKGTRSRISSCMRDGLPMFDVTSSVGCRDAPWSVLERRRVAPQPHPIHQPLSSTRDSDLPQTNETFSLSLGCSVPSQSADDVGAAYPRLHCVRSLTATCTTTVSSAFPAVGAITRTEDTTAIRVRHVILCDDRTKDATEQRRRAWHYWGPQTVPLALP